MRKRLLLKLKFSFVTAQSGPVPIASSEERRALSGEGWKLLSLLRTALQNSICSGKDCPCSQTGRGGHTGSWSCLSFPPTEQLCGHPPPMGLLVASVQIPFPQLVRRSSLFPAHQAHFKNSFLLCFSRCLLAHLAAALSWAEYLREGWEVVLWAWRGFLFFFFFFSLYFIYFLGWSAAMGLGHLHLASFSVLNREHQSFSLSCFAARPSTCQEIICWYPSLAGAGTWRLLAPRLPQASGAPRAALLAFLPQFHLVQK